MAPIKPWRSSAWRGLSAVAGTTPGYDRVLPWRPRSRLGSCMPVARLASDSGNVAALPGGVRRRTDDAHAARGQRVEGCWGCVCPSEPEDALASALRAADRPQPTGWLVMRTWLMGPALVAGRTFTHAVKRRGEGVDFPLAPAAGLCLYFFRDRDPAWRSAEWLLAATLRIRSSAGAGAGVPLPRAMPGWLVVRDGVCVPAIGSGCRAGGQGLPAKSFCLAVEGDLLGSTAGPPPRRGVRVRCRWGRWAGQSSGRVGCSHRSPGCGRTPAWSATTGPSHRWGCRWGLAGGAARDARYLAEAYELGRDEARAVAAALALIDLGERVAGELAGSVLDELDVAELNPEDPDSWVRAHLQGPAEELLSRHEQSAREVLEGHQIDVGQLVAGLADPYTALVVAEEALEGFDPQVIGLANAGAAARPAGAAPTGAGRPWTTCGAGSWSSSKDRRPLRAAYRDCLALVADHPGALISLAGIAVDRSNVPSRAQPDRPGGGRRQPPGGHIPD